MISKDVGCCRMIGCRTRVRHARLVSYAFLYTTNVVLQELPYTLVIAGNPHNPQTLIFTDSSDTTPPMPITIYCQQPIFLTPISLDATKTPQSILAPPLTSQSACNNSTASLFFMLPLNNPPIPSNVSTSSLFSFPSTQSMHAVDLTQNATRMPIHPKEPSIRSKSLHDNTLHFLVTVSVKTVMIFVTFATPKIRCGYKSLTQKTDTAV